VKKYCFILTVLSFVFYSRVNGQGHDTLQVTMHNFTYLVYDSKVIATESGTNAFFHEADKNIVSLQANNIVAKPTTLMVQTETSFYVYIIQYKQQPKRFLYNFKNNIVAEQPVHETNTKPLVNTTENRNTTETKNTQKSPRNERGDNANINTSSVVNTTTVNSAAPRKSQELVKVPSIIGNRVNTNNRESTIKDETIQNRVYWLLSNNKIGYRDMADIEANIYFSLYDLYIDDKYIYFKFNVNNTSSIAYDVDFLSIEVKHDKGLRARESTSAMLIPPSFQESIKTVFPDTNETIVYGMPLYAFEEKDKLNIKISEIGGRRSLDFNIPAKVFTNAKTLPL